MEHNKILQQISKDATFGQTDPPTFRDFLFADGQHIKDPEIVALHAKRLVQIRDSSTHCLSNSMLAEICGCSSQAIGDIIKAKKQSVNLDYCNRLAQYFECSPYYVLGVANNKMGVLIDSEEMIFPLWQGDHDEPVNVIRATQWAKLDPILFKKLDIVFHHPASSKRDLLCALIDEMF